MKGTTHTLTGVVAWEGLLIAGASGGHPWFGLAAGVAAFWGALGPDMDHPQATWAQSFPLGKRWAKFVAKRFGGHRQGTHSLLSILTVWLMIALPLWVVDIVATLNGHPFSTDYISISATAFATGWTAHILGDMLTVQGVGLFYPYSRKRLRFGNLRTSITKKLNFGEAVLVFATYCTGAVLTINLLGGFV
jgi:membrane-bound metal-dependent hydrolase YbcI (DUF457 family)